MLREPQGRFMLLTAAIFVSCAVVAAASQAVAMPPVTGVSMAAAIPRSSTLPIQPAVFNPNPCSAGNSDCYPSGGGGGSDYEDCSPLDYTCQGLPPCNQDWLDTHCEWCDYYEWSDYDQCYVYYGSGTSCPPPDGLCANPPLCV